MCLQVNVNTAWITKFLVVFESIGKTNAVFPPWPIREFRAQSDGIPECGREDSIFRGAGRFSGAQEFKHGGLSYRDETMDGLEAHLECVGSVAFRQRQQFGALSSFQFPR